MLSRIESLATELRPPLLALIENIAGSPPRPHRLTLAMGIDKSLASRLVRAVRADSDHEFLHRVPSPTGLRIFVTQARPLANDSDVRNLEAAIERFQQLLDASPGGRDAIESLISESSRDARERREHVAKQATFKSMSFLLGHYCETLATSLFLVPSSNGRTVDGIEVQHRVGLRRLRPSTAFPLLSVLTPPDEEPLDDSTWIETLNGHLGSFVPQEFLIPEFTSDPLPHLDVSTSESLTTLVFAPDEDLTSIARISSAVRIRNAWGLYPTARTQPIRGYVLHMPCRTVVRNLFIAEGVFEGGTPHVSFQLPLPGLKAGGDPDDERPHPGAIDLVAPIEQLPSNRDSFEVAGIKDHAAMLEHSLALAGHAKTRFRGWRCRLTYPVPLIEMSWSLTLPRR